MIGKPNTKEIATTQDGRDITRGYVDALPYLQPQDKILQLRGSFNYETYEEVLRDAQVHAVLTQRRLAVVSREVQVIPGGTMRIDKKAAEFIEETLQQIRWDTVTDRMLYGRFYGYAVAEALWGRDGHYITLDRLKVRNRRRFVFDHHFKPKLVTTDNPNGEELPDHKFWWFSTGADNDDEPYGLGLAHWLYWPVFFKRNQTKFWLIYLEKFGQPTAVGKYPANTDEAEQTKLLQAVQAIKADTGLVIPDGMIIELLEATRSGAADYAAFYDRMDSTIAKVVLGQTMTTDDGSSMSQAKVHMDVRQDIIEADAHLINDSFNRSIVRWLVDWNFPGAAIPQVVREMSEPPDLAALASRDKIIADMGYTPTKQYIEETYNIEVEEMTEPDRTPKRGDLNNRLPTEFAEVEVEQLEQVLDAIDDDTWQGLAEPLIRPILERATSDPEALTTELASLYPEMSAGSLQAQLERIQFVADTWARLDVK